MTAPDPRQVTAASPHLAQVLEMLAERPWWFGRSPLEVEAELYFLAQAEMAQVLKARGFDSVATANIGRPNFLLYGTPVCPKGEALH